MISSCCSVGRSNLYSRQSRNAANYYAHEAIDAFKNDARLTDVFHSLNGGRWDHMLDQTHINWFDSLEPDKDTLAPVSFINPHQPVLMGIPVPELHIPYAFSTRVTVENSYGAWPGRTADNCPKWMKCPDPTLYTMDPYGAKSRWIDISAGGPKDIRWTAKPNVPWLKVSESKGRVKRDGSTDQRIFVSVDWSKLPSDLVGQIDDGHILIQGSDGANVTVSAPIFVPLPVDDDYHGFVQGDGYVVMEAAHFSHNASAEGYAWEEMEGYGRTFSGLEMFPTDFQNFTVGQGPSLTYDFWTHDSGKAEINVQIGPSLNFISGKQLSFGVQLDDQPAKEIQPITTDRLGGVEVRPGQEPIFVGAVPPDWIGVVESDVRNVTLSVDFEQAGKHSLTVWGMSTGVVVERIWIDFGGIHDRGYSYLGPPESLRV